jgi:hypothetical protein
MKRFWQNLVDMHAASIYAEIEGVEMDSAETNKMIFSADAEQLHFQQI